MALFFSRGGAGRKAIRGAILPILLVAAWEAAVHLQFVNPRFLPPVEEILRTVWSELISGTLLENLVASLQRYILGLVIGSFIAVVFGFFIGLSRIGVIFIAPMFHGLKQIAILAWIPIICIWFGFAEMAKIVFIALAAFVPVVVNTEQGIRSAPVQYLEVSDVFCFSGFQRIRSVYLPAAMPSILTGIHLAIINTWLATVASEYFMAVGPGIGGLIMSGRENFEMNVVILGVLILGLVGYAVNQAAGTMERFLLRWRDG